MIIDFKDYVKYGNFLDIHGQKNINLAELAIFIKENPEITKLDVACCWINYGTNDDKSRLLVDLIKDSNITYLNVKGNGLNIKSAKNISELTQLTHLNIENNIIFFEGMQHILMLPNLVDLNIQDNYIGDKGVLFIAKALKNNSTITKINLTTSCKINKAQAEAIAKALQDNNTLTSINAGNISYDDNVKTTVKEDIDKKLQRNKEINEEFTQIISKITLGTDDTSILSLKEKDSEQNSCLNKLKKFIVQFMHKNENTAHVDIVNSGELDSRSDGATPIYTPIYNRRTTSNDVTNFSSIDYKSEIETLSSINKFNVLTKMANRISESLKIKQKDIAIFNTKMLEIILKLELEAIFEAASKAISEVSEAVLASKAILDNKAVLASKAIPDNKAVLEASEKVLAGKAIFEATSRADFEALFAQHHPSNTSEHDEPMKSDLMGNSSHHHTID